jgi:hypothetical protein
MNEENIVAIANRLTDYVARSSGLQMPPPQQTAPVEVRSRHISELLSKPTTVQWLIRDVIEREVIAILAGARGAFKSFIALHWSALAARAGHPVLYLSAEGAGFDRRARAWGQHHQCDMATLPIRVIERRVDLNYPPGREAVIEDIKRTTPPALIVVDTVSKCSGNLDENSNTETKAFIGALDVQLRQPHGTTILLVGHTGYSDGGRIRGASALEADTDAAYIASRVERLVTVSRERFKDSPELPPLAYAAQAVDLGYTDDEGQPVASFAMVEGEARGAALKQPTGKAQLTILRALRNRQQEANRQKDAPPLIWSLEELRKVGRDLGQHKNTARCAVDALVCSGLLTPTVGGHRLAGS